MAKCSCEGRAGLTDSLAHAASYLLRVRATMHGWRNTSSTEWARMMFVLLPSTEPEIDGKKLDEDLGIAKGMIKDSH